MSKFTIGRYEIRDELGEGGMGTVYRAFDPTLGREVALKVLQPQLYREDPEFSMRFEREARTIAALEHGSIVSLYEFGEDDDWVYIVMRLMKGGTLSDRLHDRPLSLEKTVAILHRIGSALDKAHSLGIVHRDLKPGNILFDEDGDAYLSDFGIVKVEDSTGLKTRTGQTLGTPHYMSPEQLDGKEVDGRSDIYSLGIILYEMLSGKRPYESESMARIIVMQLTAPVPSVVEANPDVTPGLDAIIRKAMAKDPKERYATAEAMVKDVQGLLLPDRSNAAATAGATLTGAATLIETSQQATVVDSTPYHDPAAATDLERGQQPGQTAVPTVPQQPAAAPKESKGKSGLVWAVVGVAVVLLLLVLGAGYFGFFGGGADEEEPAAAAASQPESVPVVAEVSSPTPTDLPTKIPTETQEADGDGDGLVGADDQCPDLPGSADTDGCPVTATLPSTAAETVTATAKPIEAITFDLPTQVSTLLSDAEAIFHDDFSELSPSDWRDAGDYETVDGLLELADTAECLARMGGLSANTAMLVQFSYDEVPNADFEMFFNNGEFGSANYRQWGAHMVDDSPEFHVVSRRSTLEESALEGDLSLEPDTGYDLLLAVDKDAEFVAHVWESDDPANFAEYRQTLEEWADQEWFGAFCNARGNVFVDTYTEIAFDELLPAAVAEAAQPTAAANQTRTPRPTVSASQTQSAASSNQTGVASTGGGLPMSFENFGTWRRGDQDNGSFTQSGEQAHSGGSSGKLSYNFPSTDNDFVVFLQLNDISGSPDALRVWVYGDGLGHHLNAWIQDNEGQTWQMPLGVVSHTGWKQLTGCIDTNQDWPWSHISGPNNGWVDYPLTFRAIVLDDVNSAYSGSGEIFIDDLEAVTIGCAAAVPAEPQSPAEPTLEAEATPTLEAEATPTPEA